MNNDKYIIDIENYLIPIEEIAKKYIEIEDIEYCVFSSKLRYPLLNKNDCKHFYHEPQMSMYCAPMMKDVIKVLLARNSYYFKYFILDYKNSFFEEFSINFIEFFKHDLKLVIPEINGLENHIIENFTKDVYNFILTNIVSFKDFNIAIENMSSNINTFLINKLHVLSNNNFVYKDNEMYRSEDVLFSQAKCLIFIENNIELFKTIYNNFIKKSSDDVYKINDNGIFNIESIIKNFIPYISNEEVEYVYNIISRMDDDVLKRLPENIADYTIDINDDNSYHIITTINHILEVRLKESEK